MWTNNHYALSTWTSRRPGAWQRDSLLGDGLRGRRGASLSLNLSHDRLRGHRRLRFPHRTAFVRHRSSLVHAAPPRRRRRLRLRLRLRLLRHSGLRHRATFHGGRAVLVGYRLRHVRLAAAHGLPVGVGHVGVALGLLVAALGSPLDGGRLLQGEVGAVGVGLGAAGPALQGRRGFGPGGVLLGVAGVSLGALGVALQTNTKYTLTEKFIHS